MMANGKTGNSTVKERCPTPMEDNMRDTSKMASNKVMDVWLTLMARSLKVVGLVV